MYIQTITTIIFIICYLFAGLPAIAQPEALSETSYTPNSNVNVERTFALYTSANLKTSPNEVEFYQLDSNPLGSRSPLLMVHGLHGEYRLGFRWNKLIKHLQSDPAFCQKYKIYFARFNSSGELNKNIRTFKEQLTSLYNSTGQRPITMMALSLGGNLVQACLQDPQVNSMTYVLFTLGTPFHGSPLFCKDWFQYSLYKNLAYPLTRIDHSVAYRIYFEHNKNLLHDLKWDNSDSFLPDVGSFRSRLPWGPAGDLTIANDGNRELLQINQSNDIIKSKLITYSGYLINPYLQPTLRRQFETTILAPYTFLTVMVPAHLAYEHPVLKMLNHEISRMIPGPKAPRVSNWPHMYGLNDGITPVCSAIFLPAEICKSIPLAKEEDLMKIKSSIDVRLARVFRNADHLTFVDGYHPRRTSSMMRDQLNPDEPSKTIFDWILSDLMEINSSASTVAKEPILDKATVKD